MSEGNTKRKEQLLQRLQDAEATAKKIKAQIQRVEARERKLLRDQELRAKTILGGFLLAHLKKNEAQFQALFEQALNEANDKDKELLRRYRESIATA